MSDATIHAVSPLDGRYAALVAGARSHLTSFALVRARVEVEVAHALALDAVFGPLDDRLRADARAAVDGFSDADFLAIAAIEADIRHDVKAVELWLRGRLAWPNPNRVHFGLTSEDVNNLAWSLCARRYLSDVQLPLVGALVAELADLAERWRAVPLLALTHGQAATPTTFGKEMAVFVARLLPLRQELAATRFRAKCNGATGNRAALAFAAPEVDWRAHERSLVAALGFDPNPATTQVEDGGSVAAWLDRSRAVHNVVMDFAQDVWLYVSRGCLKQRARPGEVGSSTMPHKVNPIRFENAEGNLQLSNALLAFLSDKLVRSRLQRDLSGSTVWRNLGVALGHGELAIGEVRRGIADLEVDAATCQRELDAHPEVVAEAIQTALRRSSRDDAYAAVHALTRGRTFDAEAIDDALVELPAALRQRLRALQPAAYIGDSVAICDEVVALARRRG